MLKLGPKKIKNRDDKPKVLFNLLPLHIQLFLSVFVCLYFSYTIMSAQIKKTQVKLFGMKFEYEWD